jgi:3-hydroxybutyryl-CoA dehydrogenase
MGVTMVEKKIRKVAVVGTGTLGTQIAILSASFGYEVSGYDRDEGSFRRTLEDLKTVVKLADRKPLLSIEEWKKASEKVTLCATLEKAAGDADLIVEAVPEDLELKREVFKGLDALAPGHAIFATNSSSIPISRIETSTARPEKCLNIHFSSLAGGINMADVMGGTRTTVETIETAKAWVRSIGCLPLTVKKEILGFCFNRVWRAIKREALHMWAGGYVDFRDIDRAWMIAYGTRLGPFGRMDRIGLDVVYDIEMVYFKESKDPKDHPPEALKAMVDRNQLGIKTRKGFYTYPDPEYSRTDFVKA